MKKTLIHCLCILLLCLAGRETAAQAVHILYVDNHRKMDSAFGHANTMNFSMRLDDGTDSVTLDSFRFALVTPANQAHFYNLATRPLRRTYDSINTATSGLRVKLNRVMALAGTRLAMIFVFLTNDSIAGLPSNPNLCTSVVGGVSIAWPCAANMRNNDLNAYTARVSLGDRAARRDMAGAGGFRRWEATIIHEFSHTQMLRDTNAVNKWDDRARRVDGIDISYGGDDGHWFDELQADEQQPMDEGLGYFWALEHNPVMRSELDTFLNNRGHRFSLGSRSFLTGTREMWDAPHVVTCDGIPCVTPGRDTLNVHLNTRITSPTGGYQLRSYRWLDVPGRYVFYNELMSECYFYLMHRYSFNSPDTAYNKIYAGVQTLCIYANQRWRYPAHMANLLANGMEAYARTAAGRTDETNGVLVSSMFAYALYDLLGHFGMTDDELRRQFDINSASYIPHTPKPIAYTRYFAIRDQVRQLACPFLGGSANCASTAAGRIDIHGAVTAVRNYFRDASRILR